MSDSELAESLIDFCDGLEASCVNLRRQIEKLTGSEVRAKWDPEAIKWEKVQGQKGEFERSEDFSNLQFKAMLKDLAQHGGRLSRNGFFYWVYRNGSTVGRKPRRG